MTDLELEQELQNEYWTEVQRLMTEHFFRSPEDSKLILVNYVETLSDMGLLTDEDKALMLHYQFSLAEELSFMEIGDDCRLLEADECFEGLGEDWEA